MGELKTIQGVEIFSVGTWNGDEYSQSDLNEMVRAFTEMKETTTPPLKLGHNKQQDALFKDGLPAAGWVGNLYTSGSKLLADFIDIPDKIYQLLKAKAYKKVSSEIFWNATFDGKKYPRMLAAVALLGGEFPAVNNLKDILSWYAGDTLKKIYYPTGDDGLMIKTYHIDDTGQGDAMPKTESEIKLEYDLKAATEKAEQDAASLKAKDSEIEANAKAIADQAKENAALKQFKADAEAKAAKDAIALEEAQMEATLVSLQSEKLISPSMKPYVKALLEEDKKEYSVKVGDKEEKLSKAELFKTVLKLHSAISSVNFKESSVEGNRPVDEDAEKVLNKKIKDYALKNEVSYGAAYRAVLKKEKESA